MQKGVLLTIIKVTVALFCILEYPTVSGVPVRRPDDSSETNDNQQVSLPLQDLVPLIRQGGSSGLDHLPLLDGLHGISPLLGGDHGAAQTIADHATGGGIGHGLGYGQNSFPWNWNRGDYPRLPGVSSLGNYLMPNIFKFFFTPGFGMDFG